MTSLYNSTFKIKKQEANQIAIKEICQNKASA